MYTRNMSQPITPSTRIEFIAEMDRARRSETRTAREWLGVDDTDPVWDDQATVVGAVEEACREWTASQLDSGWGVV